MEVIWLLLPIGLMIAGGFLISYFWAVRSGQYDDTTTPAYRILIEDEPAAGPERTKKQERPEKIATGEKNGPPNPRL